MKVMAVNAGSSSLKYKLFDMPSEAVICSGIIERIGSNEAESTIKFNDLKQNDTLPILDHKHAVKVLLDDLIKYEIIKKYDEIQAVGHRVVQGGELFTKSTLVNDDVIKKITGLCDLAPLHNPAHLMGIAAFTNILPTVKQAVIFDTTFHQTMSKDAFMYATPYEWYEKYGVRKYGAHGTSHDFVSKEIIKKLGNPTSSKVIVCHLGNGASLCAVKDGISVDTSMGLTPLEGIPMGTRSGNVDPTVFGLINSKENIDISEILNVLNKASGYLGVSGISHDFRDLDAAIKNGSELAQLALDVQAKRIADYIGSYYVYMEGLDAIAFTAGIGENAPLVRKLICERLKVLGVKINHEINDVSRSQDIEISTDDSKVKVFVIPTDEEVVIARDTYNL